MARDDPKASGIIEAASKLFVAHGYAATSTDMIAAEANASKATIYGRFGSKEDLFGAVLLDACKGVEAPAPDRLTDETPLDELLYLSGQALLYRVFQPRALALIRAAIGAQHAAPRALDIYWENGPGHAQRAVEAALTRAKISDAPAKAKRFLNLVTGPFLLGVLVQGARLPTREEMDDALDLVVSDFLDRLPL